jgi:hypothetical protein
MIDQANDHRLDTDTVASAVDVTVTGIPPPPDSVEPARAIEASVHAPKLCARGLALQNIEKETAQFERNYAIDDREMTHLRKRKADCDAETARHVEIIVKSQKLKEQTEKNSQAFQEKIEVLEEKRDQNYKIVMEGLGERKEKAGRSLRRMQVRAHAELGEQLKGTRYEEGIPDSDESDSPPSEAWNATIDSPTVFDVDDSDEELPPPKKKARFASRPKPNAPIPCVTLEEQVNFPKKGAFPTLPKIKGKVFPKK